MPQQIQLRRGAASAWTTANPVLAAGELGAETDSKKFKVGDGTTAWNSLTYASMSFRGAYSGATAYTVNDVVTYNGQTYICILASTGNLPTNTTYWSVLASKGADGTNGTNGEVSLTAAQTISNKTIVSAKYTVSALGSISGSNTLDLAAATEFTATLTGATTFAFSNAPGAGSGQVVYLRLTNAGATTITWPANTKFAGGTAPTLTSAGVDVLAVKYDLATTTYQVFVIGLDVK